MLNNLSPESLAFSLTEWSVMSEVLSIFWIFEGSRFSDETSFLRPSCGVDSFRFGNVCTSEVEFGIGASNETHFSIGNTGNSACFVAGASESNNRFAVMCVIFQKRNER